MWFNRKLNRGEGECTFFMGRIKGALHKRCEDECVTRCVTTCVTRCNYLFISALYSVFLVLLQCYTKKRKNWGYKK